MTEAGVASNRFKLGRKRTVLEQLSDALLVIRLNVYSDSQQKGMIFAAVSAVNRNITCWRRARDASTFLMLCLFGIRRLVQRLWECTRQFDYAGRRYFTTLRRPLRRNLCLS